MRNRMECNQQIANQERQTSTSFPSANPSVDPCRALFVPASKAFVRVNLSARIAEEPEK